MERRRKVLFIDDSHEDLATYSTYLLSSASNAFVVATAASSATGIALCGTFQPDCLVLDLHIDTLDGLAVLERARERAGYVPTIILTGQGSEHCAVESLKRGAWTYLVKAETTPEALAKAVRDALDDYDLQEELREQRRREERARAELESAYERAKFLARISEILIASMQRDEFVAAVVREIVASVAEACFIDIVIEGVLQRIGAAVPASAYTAPRPHYAPHVDGREGVARVLRSGEPVVYGTTWLDTVVPFDNDVAGLVKHELQSLAVVPLAFGGSVFGAITFAALKPRSAYGSAELDHFLEVGRRLSAAIVNANLFAGERRARTLAESAQRRLTIVSQASSLFARSLEWKETLRRLTRVLVPQFADWTGVFVAGAESATAIELIASRHTDSALDDAYAELCAPVPSSTVFLARLAIDVEEPESGFPANRLAALGVRSVIAVPLVARGQQFGSLAALIDSERGEFELDDVALLEDLGRRIGTYLESASIYRRERDIAQTLQRSLLPDAIPAFADLSFATRYLPGTEGVNVGGDWYDAIAVGERRVAFVIGDVSGRGVRAAAIMGKLRATVRAYILDGIPPAGVLERANRAAESMGVDHFATVLCAILDRDTGRLTFANGGHPPPLLVLPNECSVLDQDPGVPIGVIKNAAYTDVTVHVDAGAVFLLYTDGLVEHRTRFAADGIAELCRQAQRHCGGDLENYVDDLLAAMTGGRHDDDVALVAVRRLHVPAAVLERTGSA